MSFEVEDCLAFLTNHGGKLLDESMNRRFQGEEITRTQWTALYHIDHQQGITQKELAQAMKISEPSASNLLDRLEHAGLVERVADEHNGRIKHLQLTKSGRSKLEELAHIPEEFNRDAVEGISEEDVETFKRVLRTMVEQSK